jgi:hypothetical protein
VGKHPSYLKNSRQACSAARLSAKYLDENALKVVGFDRDYASFLF